MKKATRKTITQASEEPREEQEEEPIGELLFQMTYCPTGWSLFVMIWMNAILHRYF